MTVNDNGNPDGKKPGADGQTWMDEHALAIDQTMVRFLADTDHPVVPSHAGLLRLTVLGSGSVVVNQVRHLSIGEGYVTLRPRAIFCATALEQLELPHTLQDVSPGFIGRALPGEILCHLRLTEAEVDLLREASLPCGGKKRILVRSQLSGEGFRVPQAAFGCMAPALPFLREEMYTLLQGGRQISIFERQRCFDLTGTETNADEYATVMRMIREGAAGWRHPEAERLSDLVIRTGTNPNLSGESLSLAEYEPEKTVPMPDGRFAVELRLITRELTAPALLPIRQEGKQYYLYSRLHMKNNPACPYWREDMGIFDGDGLITDRKISEAVYVKARLPMLL